MEAVMFAHTQAKPMQNPAYLQAKRFVQVTNGLDAPGFTMTFSRDEEIYGEGEEAEFVYTVVSGVVRTHRVLDDGRRQISSFHFAGDVFGLEMSAEHMSSAEAVTPCEISLVKRVVLDRMTKENPACARQLWELASRELSHARAHLMLLGRKTALERVATFLIELGDREADDADDDAVKIPMSRSDIADYLGLTIETVSRTLTQLEREGAIALPNCRQIILRNRAALDRLDA
jgi:CRP/FNR family transcriptional regulator, nitrogen fixation regulation protein